MGAAASDADPARRRREAGRAWCSRGGADEGPRPRRAAARRPARPGALRRHRRRRAVRHRPDHAGPRHPGQRQRRATTRRRSQALRDARRPGARRPRRRAGRTTPTPWSCRRRSARTTPSSSRRGDAGLRLLPALGRPGLGDGGQAGRRRRRHPRQDHDHVAADRRAAGRRRRPVVRHRRRPEPAPASNADDGTGDLFVAEADESDGAFLVYSPYGRRGHQRRRRPPRPLGHRGGLPGGLRRLPRPDRARRLPGHLGRRRRPPPRWPARPAAAACAWSTYGRRPTAPTCRRHDLRHGGSTSTFDGTPRRPRRWAR